MPRYKPPAPPVILQVLPRLETGGVERGTIEIARALAREGWGSLVASAPGQLVPQLAYAGATHIPLPLHNRSPLNIFLNRLRLERIIRKYNVNIVHARSRAPAWSAYFAAKSTDTHFITTFHGVYGLQSDWKKKYNSIMTRGERVIAVSDFIAQHIVKNYDMKRENLRIIHRGVDLDLFRPDAAHPQRMVELSKAWNIPEHLPIIMFPGRITRWKGQHVFLNALSQLPHRNFFAVLVGDFTEHEDYRDELEEFIRESNLEGHARLVGNTAYMVEAYHLSKFVVATSIDPEAFGRVVLEAQAMGKPVIATNHGGARETVREGITGWLVEPGGVEALCKMIDYVLHMDKAALEWMGWQGMENARNFSAALMCDKTLNIYQEILGKW